MCVWHRWGDFGYWLVLSIFGLTCTTLSIRPADAGSIHFFSGFLHSAFLTVLPIWAAFSALGLSGVYYPYSLALKPALLTGSIGIAIASAAIPAGYSLRTLEIRPGAKRASMLEVWSRTVDVAGIVVASTLFVWPVLWLGPWAMVQGERGHFAMSPRESFRANWMATRLAVGSWACCYMLTVLIAYLEGVADPLIPSLAFYSVSLGCTALVCHPHNVGRTHTFLGSFQVSEEARSAAGVAALVGGLGATTALALATQRFSGVPFTALSLEHFKSNDQHTVALSEHAHPATPGEVDAFLSHSWRDSPMDKWAALVEWADGFTARHDRTPMLWLEYVFNPQRRPSSHPQTRSVDQAQGVPLYPHARVLLEVYRAFVSLLHLTVRHASSTRTSRPISRAFPYFSRAARSCSSSPAQATPHAFGYARTPLRVTRRKRRAGSHQTRRPCEPDGRNGWPNSLVQCWHDACGWQCIIEVFTFLKMGGSTERMTMVVISGADERQLHFDDFEVQQATCFHEGERQTLLSALETGFGSLDAFNSLMSNVYKETSSTGAVRTVVPTDGYEQMPPDAVWL